MCAEGSERRVLLVGWCEIKTGVHRIMGDVIDFRTRTQVSNQTLQAPLVLASALYVLGKFNPREAQHTIRTLETDIQSRPLEVYRALAEILLLDHRVGLAPFTAPTDGRLLSAVRLAITGESYHRDERIALCREIVRMPRDRLSMPSYLDALYAAVEVTVHAGANAAESAKTFVEICTLLRRESERSGFARGVCTQLAETIKQ